MSWRRRLADGLGRGVDRAMPAHRRAWADAMRIELAHIDDDGAALGFAVGALQAAIVQSLAEATTMLRLGRWGVAAAAALMGAAVLRLLVLVGADGGAGLPAILAVVALVLGALHLAAAWTLARWRLAAFAASLSVVFAVLTLTAAALASAGTPPPHLDWLRALMFEQFAATVFFAVAGVFFWRTRPLLGSPA